MDERENSTLCKPTCSKRKYIDNIKFPRKSHSLIYFTGINIAVKKNMNK